MADNKMKVMTALATYDSIMKASAHLNMVMHAIDHDAEIHDALMKKVNEQVVGEGKDPSYMLNGAIHHLQEYGQLLKDAIDHTEMEWPPQPGQ